MRFPAAVGIILLAIGLAAPGCSRSDKELAIEAIQEVGGTIRYDDQGHIVSVDFSDTPATDQHVAAVGWLPHVRTLNCTNAHEITGAHLDQLIHLQHLETLYLVGTQLDDAGLARLQGLKSLKTLSLDGTRITDDGMPAIDQLTNLQTLVLGDTAITDRGLVQLRDLRKLSTLVLRDTKTTPRGTKELRRMLPDVRIVD